MTHAPTGACPALAAACRPRLLAVASGKGGVGKTWLAATLSRALVQAGRRVLLFDGDLGLANVDIQLGLLPDHDLAAVIAGRRSLADAWRLLRARRLQRAGGPLRLRRAVRRGPGRRSTACWRRWRPSRR